MFVHFLKKRPDANEFLEQPTVVSSVIDERRNKKTSKLVKWKELNDLWIHSIGY